MFVLISEAKVQQMPHKESTLNQRIQASTGVLPSAIPNKVSGELQARLVSFWIAAGLGSYPKFKPQNQDDEIVYLHCHFDNNKTQKLKPCIDRFWLSF